MLHIRFNKIGPERNSGDLYVMEEYILAMAIGDFRDHLFLWKG